MPRTLLIVDDIATNRAILKKILGEEYDILEASNGEEAFKVMGRSYKVLSAVLLDLVMPVMDGFEVLAQMRGNAILSQIPVIVTTSETGDSSEVRALTLGANDYITKPYNSTIIRQRIKNTIRLRETAATVNSLQRDKLTGLYNREAFFDRVSSTIKTHQPGDYVLACFDINNFKVINDQYGSDKGDAVLRYIATKLQQHCEPRGALSCRIMADNFAVLYPTTYLNSDELGAMEREAAAFDGSIPPLVFSIGRYVINDLALSVGAMYDRAAIAKASVKGRFDVHAALFSESMRSHILLEQRIVNEMKDALEGGQFEVWYQPQFNHATGALTGAEALVRWRHPARGLIPPAEFIPVFERNGFIYELDKYVWEQVCAYQERHLGDAPATLPISVNVSRYDLFRDDLVASISEICRRHGVPAGLIHIEITESAFTESTDRIIDMVEALMANGHTVEIDDFGSGYSSLNILKDVPASVLKLDMGFLERGRSTTRGGNIIESVVRMAKWLGMSVIAEGVETDKQAEYLTSIGCHHIQGFLYARPMPADEYEFFQHSTLRENRLQRLKTIENLDNNTFWDPASMETLIFNSYVGGACIFEFSGDHIELLRANEKYVQAIGGAGMTIDDALKLNWKEHLDEDNLLRAVEAVRRSMETGGAVTDNFVFLDLPGCPHKTYLRSTMRVIASTDERCLVYCTNENITAQREAEQKEKDSFEQLQIIMKNITGGVTATVVTEEKPLLLFTNEQYFEQLGYTRAQYEAEVKNPFDPLFPADRARVEARTRLIRPGESASISYRVVRRDGTVRWLMSNISLTTFPGVDGPVQLSVANDITAVKQAEQRAQDSAERLQVVMKNVVSGIVASVCEGERVRILFSNDRYYDMLGYTREAYAETFGEGYGPVCPADKERVAEAVTKTLETGAHLVIEHGMLRKDGREIYVRQRICKTHFADVPDDVLLSVIYDITEDLRAGA